MRSLKTERVATVVFSPGGRNLSKRSALSWGKLPCNSRERMHGMKQVLQSMMFTSNSISLWPFTCTASRRSGYVVGRSAYLMEGTVVRDTKRPIVPLTGFLLKDLI